METNNLGKLREECALTHQMIADALGIDRSTYTCYETGKSRPPIKRAVKLAKIFGVSVEALYDSDALEAIKSTAIGTISEPFNDYNLKGQPMASDFTYSMLKKTERYLISNFRILPPEEQERILDEILSITGGKN